MNTKVYTPLRRLIGILSLFLFVATAHATPYQTRGIYTDKSGNRHYWSINSAHTLIWDDKPFVPVGGLFQAQSWSGHPSAADFDADVAALSALKAKHLMDIYIQPTQGGLTGVSPEAIQRLLDYLDKEGFTYGISINDAPHEPLLGHLVRPGAFRQVVPESGGILRFPTDNLGSSLYVLAGAPSGEIVETGQATLVSEGARVSVSPRPGSFVVFLVPEKIYPYGSSLSLPNVWEGVDSYRDSLITLFSQVKLGKGFRFFVDPLSADLALSDEFDHLIPSNTAFATEWGVWLARRYKNIDTLQNSWGVSNRELNTIADASDLIPLWSGGKGVEALYSKTTGKRYAVNVVRSTFWSDLNLFKAESVRGYMNDLATALKRGIADVPVVYRSRGYSPLFSNLPPQRGFDGIGMDVYGRGRDLVVHGAGYIYAQAAEAGKTMWLPVIATQDAREDSKREFGYPSRATLMSDLDWLREIGARGFYVDGVRVVNPARKNFDLSQKPEQLGWLSEYSGLLATTGVSAQPTAVFYPRNLPAASLRTLANGAWWLPTDRPATLFDFGLSGRAYAMDEGERGTVYYLWNPSGSHTVRIRLPKASKLPNAPRIQVSGTEPSSLKNDILTLTVGPEPIRIINLPGVPVPLDAFEETYGEAKKLVELAQKENRVDAGRMEQMLLSVRSAYIPDDPLPGYTRLREVYNTLKLVMRPYYWMEAERAATHSFDEIIERPGASEGKVLVVGDRASSGSATATFVINVGGTESKRPFASSVTDPASLRDANEKNVYQVWAATTPGANITFRVDGQPLDETTAPRTAGASYADGSLVWTNYGPALLGRGIHTIELRADSKAAVDVVLLTRTPFVPNGTTQPQIVP